MTDPAIRFRLIPNFRWRPLERETVSEIKLDETHRWEVACFSWLSFEAEGYFVRDCGPYPS